VQSLDYSWDEVHEEAERLEHAISERLAQRIAEYLGHPDFDPHGDPIPGPDGDVSQRDLTPLSEWPLGEIGRVSRLLDQSPEMLRYLADKGLTIGAVVKVENVDPFDGPMTLTVNTEQQVIGMNVAQYILMARKG